MNFHFSYCTFLYNLFRKNRINRENRIYLLFIYLQKQCQDYKNTRKMASGIYRLLRITTIICLSVSAKYLYHASFLFILICIFFARIENVRTRALQNYREFRAGLNPFDICGCLHIQCFTPLDNTPATYTDTSVEFERIAII